MQIMVNFTTLTISISLKETWSGLRTSMFSPLNQVHGHRCCHALVSK